MRARQVGIVQIGGSSTSRSRRFHGSIAEIVHYSRILSHRELHAIGHYLQVRPPLRPSAVPPCHSKRAQRPPAATPRASPGVRASHPPARALAIAAQV